MTITIRQATAADATVISALNADVQAIHAAALPERFKPTDRDSFPAAEVDILLARSDNFIFLAHVDQTPAGYAFAEVVRLPETSLTRPYEALHLHHISVGAKYRRMGIGSALLNTLRAMGTNLGITLVTADVWSFNDGARAFFRRQGFDQYIERLWSRQNPE